MKKTSAYTHLAVSVFPFIDKSKRRETISGFGQFGMKGNTLTGWCSVPAHPLLPRIDYQGTILSGSGNGGIEEKQVRQILIRKGVNL